MREYSITRSTMEWTRIINAIQSGHVSAETGSLINDVCQALEHDNNHVHGKGIELPDRMSSSNDPVIPWRNGTVAEKAARSLQQMLLTLTDDMTNNGEIQPCIDEAVACIRETLDLIHDVYEVDICIDGTE